MMDSSPLQMNSKRQGQQSYANEYPIVEDNFIKQCNKEPK